MSVSPAAATPGELDPSFGDDGKVVTKIGTPPRFVSLRDLAVGPAGGVIVGGSIHRRCPCRLLLARYLPDGRLDPRFSDDGWLLAWFHAGGDLAVQSDGRILVTVGSLNQDRSDFMVARYTARGALDRGFGQLGRVRTRFGGDFEGATDVALLPSGKIVAAGVSGTATSDQEPFWEAVVARYRADGSLDSSFGTDGRVFVPPLSGVDELLVQPNGKILIAGNVRSEICGDTGVVVARLTRDGQMDGDFGEDGVTHTEFGQCSDLSDAILTVRGKILAAGVAWFDLEGSRPAFAQFTRDGRLDHTFRSGGVSTQDNFVFARALATEADGQIVAAGYLEDERTHRLGFAVARYGPRGRLDPTFGKDGIVRLFRRYESRASAVAIQSDGKIVTAGEARASGVQRLALARLLAD